MSEPSDPSTVDGTVDLLNRPWVFSQRHLLTEKNFIDEAKRRGLFLSESGLEILHKHSVLVPLLRVERDLAKVRRELRRKQPSPWHWEILTGSPPTTAPALAAEWDAGRVSEGSINSFEPWQRRRKRHKEVSYKAWDYLYSPYQLLLLRDCRETLSLLARRPRPSWADGFLAAHQKAASRERRLIPLLSDLEFVYYAAVRRRYSIPMDYGSEADYQSAVREFDRVAVLARYGFAPDVVLKAAEHWLFTAHSWDPLRNWTALVSLIDPGKWERLEGEALLAMDFRIAAEMLLRFLEDLQHRGEAEPLPDLGQSTFYHPLDDRIGRQRSRLERTLTDFGISPHPAVIMILEGPSEMYVIKELMAYFGIPRLDSFIRLQLLGGVTKQIELLARYVAPALGRTRSNLAEMDRPPTRLMVVVDQEGAYATPTGRNAAKEQLVKHLYNALEPQHQTPTALQELGFLVEVETWGPAVKNLEFAHFTDHALAKAIYATGRAPVTETVVSLEIRIAGLRQGGGNLKRIWRDWPDPQPDKVEVWHHLWPVLQARIRRAGKSQTEEHIPLVRVLWAAYRIAGGPRSNTVLRI